MQLIIRKLLKHFLDLYLCNREKCYRVVMRKNGVCCFCKIK